MRLKHIPTILLLTSFLSGCSSAQSSTEPVIKSASSVPFEETDIFKSVKEAYLTTMPDESPSITYDPTVSTITITSEFPDSTLEEVYTAIMNDDETMEYWTQTVSAKADLCNRTRKEFIENGYVDIDIYMEVNSTDGYTLFTIYNGTVLFNIAD